MEFILEHIIDILFVVIIPPVIYMYRKIKKLLNTIENTKNSMINITKTIFIEKYYHYKKQNYIHIYEKEIINNLYTEYKKLGGSGIIEELYTQIDAIPLKEKINKKNE